MKKFFSSLFAALLILTTLLLASCNNSAENGSLSFTLGETAAAKIAQTVRDEISADASAGTYTVSLYVYQYMEETVEPSEENGIDWQEMEEKMFRFEQEYTVTLSELATKTFTVENIPIDTPFTISLSVTYSDSTLTYPITLYYGDTEPFSIWEPTNTIVIELNKGYDFEKDTEVLFYIENNSGSYDLQEQYTTTTKVTFLQDLITKAKEDTQETFETLATRGYELTDTKTTYADQDYASNKYVVKFYFDRVTSKVDVTITGAASTDYAEEFPGTFTLEVYKNKTYAIFYTESTSSTTSPIVFARGIYEHTVAEDKTETVIATETEYYDTNTGKNVTDAIEKIQELIVSNETFTYTPWNNVVITFKENKDDPSQLESTFTISVELETIEGDTGTVSLEAAGTTITATEGFSVYKWTVDGVELSDTGKSIDVSGYSLGRHNVTVIVDEGKSAGTTFTITAD